ncbi:asparaginyl/glutamyl-tRNA amidotransferase subunit C [Helicobacter sp. 12S02634-8]|uniref:Asp-tRNA(Asn)/Glu-tRNA(Gln) amidotransferase subunit GatC n=1 Tax=Helicobacter sp. 12S02634-8 TaxID=1476199 RepID=UPI000BA4F98F|nr:Asp-tRNA(Asn)/Glu-tRNA(Gln) amidotransferase subunit GatC [Helicobacter sp. 12S02634-8]PAF46830.1 asparaginyl/glutamyl-tRNA amidotransferase subunit C [Helicobacter sp. 12S02634-8]
MTIDDPLLQKLQKLGMIQIDPQKSEAIKKSLEDILGFVENIADLPLCDTQDKIQELADPNHSINAQKATPLRADTPAIDPTIPPHVLKNAPEAKDGYFIVPKIIE